MTGYTLQRTLPTTADQVFEFFVEPTRFAQWFVVPGYQTPSERIRVDARPGGRIEAVVVSDADGSEVPFTVGLGEVDPPRLIVLHPGQGETVTVRLSEDAGTTKLGYDYQGPATGEADVAATEAMLDHITAHLAE